MSKNKLKIKPLKDLQKNSDAFIEKFTDDWVGVSPPKAHIKEDEKSHFIETSFNEPKERQLNLIKESRFTIVIPSYLHTRIKKHCAINSVPMKKLLTEILLKQFPEQ